MLNVSTLTLICVASDSLHRQGLIRPIRAHYKSASIFTENTPARESIEKIHIVVFPGVRRVIPRPLCPMPTLCPYLLLYIHPPPPPLLSVLQHWASHYQSPLTLSLAPHPQFLEYSLLPLCTNPRNQTYIHLPYPLSNPRMRFLLFRSMHLHRIHRNTLHSINLAHIPPLFPFIISPTNTQEATHSAVSFLHDLSRTHFTSLLFTITNHHHNKSKIQTHNILFFPQGNTMENKKSHTI